MIHKEDLHNYQWKKSQNPQKYKILLKRGFRRKLKMRPLETAKKNRKWKNFLIKVGIGILTSSKSSRKWRKKTRNIGTSKLICIKRSRKRIMRGLRSRVKQNLLHKFTRHMTLIILKYRQKVQECHATAAEKYIPRRKVWILMRRFRIGKFLTNWRKYTPTL